MIIVVSDMQKVNLYLCKLSIRDKIFQRSESECKDAQNWAILCFLDEGIRCTILWQLMSVTIASSVSQSAAAQDGLYAQADCQSKASVFPLHV